ncbi:MAG: hypothetical protein SOI38_03940 [Eggerthellaceae bacterium]|jgi:hypothetical protein
MKMSGSARDFFSHMKLLGLAAIVSSYPTEGGVDSLSPVTVWWESPDTMVLSSLTHDVSVEQAAACVRAYLDDLARDEKMIRQTVKVGGKDHSPLSPRIAKSLTDQEWTMYQGVRQEIIDHAEGNEPLFARLVNALGFPAYWSTSLEGAKGKLNLDSGASQWEMAPRNSGSEFMKNKYLEHVRACEQLSVDDIAARIRGDEADDCGKDRNASGLHAPAYLDVLMSLVALSGIALFPTAMATTGQVGSVSTAVTTQRANGRKQTHFVLPIVNRAVTIERYQAICRNASVYRIANAAFQSSQVDVTDSLAEASASWLHAHDVDHVVAFQRFVGGSDSCPEYYALEGEIYPVR